MIEKIDLCNKVESCIIICAYFSHTINWIENNKLVNDGDPIYKGCDYVNIMI